jgi:hypothetical protein
MQGGPLRALLHGTLYPESLWIATILAWDNHNAECCYLDCSGVLERALAREQHSRVARD